MNAVQRRAFHLFPVPLSLDLEGATNTGMYKHGDISPLLILKKKKSYNFAAFDGNNPTFPTKGKLQNRHGYTTLFVICIKR